MIIENVYQQWQLGEKELEEGKENVVCQTSPGFQAKLQRIS